VTTITANRRRRQRNGSGSCRLIYGPRRLSSSSSRGNKEADVSGYIVIDERCARVDFGHSPRTQTVEHTAPFNPPSNVLDVRKMTTAARIASRFASVVVGFHIGLNVGMLECRPTVAVKSSGIVEMLE